VRAMRPGPPQPEGQGEAPLKQNPGREDRG
jgi:hypothetical protein